MLEKVIAFFAELWYVLWLPKEVARYMNMKHLEAVMDDASIAG